MSLFIFNAASNQSNIGRLSLYLNSKFNKNYIGKKSENRTLFILFNISVINQSKIWAQLDLSTVILFESKKK